MKEFYVENKLSVHIREKSEYWTKRFDVDARLKVSFVRIYLFAIGFILSRSLSFLKTF